MFATGEYYQSWKFHNQPPPDPLPATIEALIELAGQDGTHSILDYPADMLPEPCSALMLLLGTRTPSPALIDELLRMEAFWHLADGHYLAMRMGSP